MTAPVSLTRPAPADGALEGCPACNTRGLAKVRQLEARVAELLADKARLLQQNDDLTHQVTAARQSCEAEQDAHGMTRLRKDRDDLDVKIRGAAQKVADIRPGGDPS